MIDVHPLAPEHGYGFYSYQPLTPEQARGYRFEQIGRYFNYHYTQDRHDWPFPSPPRKTKIEGFAPNLNKQLHIGHLRNLALASALHVIMEDDTPVAMLGASLGELPFVRHELQFWFDLASYHPQITLDTELPTVMMGRPGKASEVVAGGREARDYTGCQMWDGPVGPVVIIRSANESGGGPARTYAYHDLVYAQEVAPTHYITGHEQLSHFGSIGLSEKHLPMGLVVGADGKKLKSRTGDAMMAMDVIQMIENKLLEREATRAMSAENLRKLSWNVLAWNFLGVARRQNVIFDPEDWTNPNKPGLYITYTYARFMKALAAAADGNARSLTAFEDRDMPLLATATYSTYYIERSRKTMDATPLAQYVLTLAKKMGELYSGEEKIVGGRASLQNTVAVATTVLKVMMRCLSMWDLEQV